MSGVPSFFSGPLEPGRETLPLRDDGEPLDEYPEDIGLAWGDLFTAYLMSGVPSLF